jgi:hypothetical protein
VLRAWGVKSADVKRLCAEVRLHLLLSSSAVAPARETRLVPPTRVAYELQVKPSI